MKIKTYTARDMKGALRQVREDQGPDAVILSTRHLSGSVEVVVALEPEEAVTLEAPAASADAKLGSELRSMRQLLEAQVSQLAWSDLARRAPSTVELLKELTAMGVAGDLAVELLREMPAGINSDDAHRRMLAALARRIRTTGDELLDHGGRVAFVGPTGVGKTTGIAKLAARWVMRHGPRDIALVSLDNARFGAHEQLRVLGRLLGVECYSLEDPAGLAGLLARLPRHRLVLIDTAGISPRDSQLNEHASALVDATKNCEVDLWLTLSASAQAGVIQDTVRAFGACQPRALLLTRLDEAASLGGVLSALAASGLPVSYVAGGPRIPEDLAPARAHQLVARAVFLARSSDTSVGEELLVRRFGGVANGIR